MRDQGLMDTSLFSSNKRLRLVFRLNNVVWLKTALNQEYWQIEGRSVPAADVAQLHVVWAYMPGNHRQTILAYLWASWITRIRSVHLINKRWLRPCDAASNPGSDICNVGDGSRDQYKPNIWPAKFHSRCHNFERTSSGLVQNVNLETIS